MKITCIGCLHDYYPELPGGDLLIITGDLTARDEYDEYQHFYEWVEKQDYKRKIIIAGNHDNKLVDDLDFDFPDLGIEYLEDSGTEFEGLKVWGSPWTASFHGINPKCTAFTIPFGCDIEHHLKDKWNLIPDDTDILITHSPPFGIYDKTKNGILAGSKSLLIRLAEIKPKLHCFSHIHEQGAKDMWLPWNNGTYIVNCSIMNEHYKPVNKPVTIDI